MVGATGTNAAPHSQLALDRKTHTRTFNLKTQIMTLHSCVEWPDLVLPRDRKTVMEWNRMVWLDKGNLGATEEMDQEGRGTGMETGGKGPVGLGRARSGSRCCISARGRGPGGRLGYPKSGKSNDKQTIRDPGVGLKLQQLEARERPNLVLVIRLLRHKHLFQLQVQSFDAAPQTWSQSVQGQQGHRLQEEKIWGLRVINRSAAHPRDTQESPNNPRGSLVLITLFSRIFSYLVFSSYDLVSDSKASSLLISLPRWRSSKDKATWVMPAAWPAGWAGWEGSYPAVGGAWRERFCNWCLSLATWGQSRETAEWARSHSGELGGRLRARGTRLPQVLCTSPGCRALVAAAASPSSRLLSPGTRSLRRRTQEIKAGFSLIADSHRRFLVFLIRKVH